MKSNDRFGYLTLKRMSHVNRTTNEEIWIAKCDCGREIAASESELLNGEKVSCGRKKGCHANMLNQKYGKFTVIDVNYNFKQKVKCLCECGNERMVLASDLKCGKHMSCGCSRKHNYKKKAESHIGERYGSLTILEPILVESTNLTKQNKYKYRCQCDCGAIVEVFGNHLFTGHTTSCGCVKSKANELMDKLLTSLQINFKREYKFNDCRDKRPLPFDFAIFNSNNELLGLIELNGLQHYSTQGRGFYTKERLFTIHQHDYIKQKFCEDNQIELLTIPYNYFEPNKMKEFLQTSDFWTNISLKLND